VPILPVVLLPVDGAVAAVQFALNVSAFAGREPAAGTTRTRFVKSDPRFAPFDPARFAARQFAAAHTLSDAPLLAGFPSINAARILYLRRRGHE
jgi:hypothetical protein